MLYLIKAAENEFILQANSKLIKSINKFNLF